MPPPITSIHSGPNGGLWQVFWYPLNQVAIDYSREQTRGAKKGESIRVKQHIPKSKAKGKQLGALVTMRRACSEITSCWVLVLALGWTIMVLMMGKTCL